MKNSNNSALRVKENNNIVAKTQKDLSLLERALQKDKKQSNLDFFKIAIGDTKENQRLKMRQYQEASKLT
jgi:hypothetical protein